MNSDNNHLVTADLMKKLDPDAQRFYETLPPELQEAARRKLAGRSEATVARRSGGKLSSWAARRREQRRRTKQREQKRSRARNR